MDDNFCRKWRGIMKRAAVLFLIASLFLRLCACRSGENSDEIYKSLISDFEDYFSFISKTISSEEKEELDNKLTEYLASNGSFQIDKGDRKDLINALRDSLLIVSDFNSDDYYYKIEDINADGNTELMFYGPNDFLISLLTQSDGKTVLLDTYYSRLTGVITENGKILRSNSTYGYTKYLAQLCEISLDGTSIEVIGECGTELTNDSDSSRKFYVIIDDKKEYVGEEKFNEMYSLFEIGKTEKDT